MKISRRGIKVSSEPFTMASLSSQALNRAFLVPRRALRRLDEYKRTQEAALTCCANCLISFSYIPLLCSLLQNTVLIPSTVSWNWGATGQPSGVASKVVADKLTITTKGKEISKNGDEKNPAVHIERKGNDVVKRASELKVVEKGEENTGDKEAEKKEGGHDESKETAAKDGKEDLGPGEAIEKKEDKMSPTARQEYEAKRAAEEKADEKAEEKAGKKEEANGKDTNMIDAAQTGSPEPEAESEDTNSKKRKEPEDGKEEAEKKNGEPDSKKAKTDDKTEDKKETNGTTEKRGKGRPKKGESKSDAKPKKEPSAPTRRSTRTRTGST